MKKLRELLCTNRWFAVVLLLEAAVLVSLAASLFGAPYRLQLTPADFSNDYPQIAAVNEDGTTLQIWNNSEDFTPLEDKAISFSTAGSAMRSGAYEVTIQYFSCETPDTPTFNALHSAGSLSFSSKGNPSAVRADTVTLDDCHRTVTTRLWVGYGARMQDLTATLTYGEGQLYLYGITLTEQPIYRLTQLVIFVLLAAVLNFFLLLLFACGDTNAPARRRKYAVPLILAGITVAACLPLFSNYLYFGHDLDYHLQRISAMAAELSYGQFPVRMTTDSLNGYGYANSLCYCELFLTLPALLYNAWLPLRTCYQVYIFAVTLSTAIIAYCSFGKITASRKLGLLGAALYTLSCYRLVCTYIRASVGEYTAITFLPLVLVGLYNIYTTEKPRFAQWAPMAFGMAALVQCHLLSCELIALLLVVFCLLRLQDTLHLARLLAWVKAALLAVALSAWYFFPFLISTHEINLMVNGPLIGKIQNQGTYLVQLFSPFGPGYGGTAGGTSTDMTLSIGLPLTAGLALILYCLLRRERWQQQAALRRMQWAFGFAVLALGRRTKLAGPRRGQNGGHVPVPLAVSIAGDSIALPGQCAGSAAAEREKRPPGQGCSGGSGGLRPADCRCGTDADHIGHGGTVLQCVPEQRPQCFHRCGRVPHRRYQRLRDHLGTAQAGQRRPAPALLREAGRQGLSGSGK